MPCETVQLPQIPPYQQRATAKFLSIVAFPTDPRKRQRFENAAGASVLRRRALADPEWAWTPQLVTPGLLLIDPKFVQKVLDDCGYLIVTRRLPAAQMAGTVLADEGMKQFDPVKLGALFSAMAGRPISKGQFKIQVELEDYDPRTETNVTRRRPPTINALAEHTAQTLNKAPEGWGKRRAKKWTRTNVLTRIWTPTKPVLHLALVLRGVIIKKFGDRDVNLDELLEGEWLQSAVRMAEATRLHLLESGRFRIGDDQTIQVLLKEN